MEDIEIAVIKKNATDELRIAVKQYEGITYVDIRTFTEYHTTGQMGPTKKGVTVSLRRLPEVIAALQAAQLKIEELAIEVA